MGIFSSLFSSGSQEDIDDCKKRISNFQDRIEIIKKNTANKTAAHYRKSANEQIKTLRGQIAKEREKLKKMKK